MVEKYNIEELIIRYLQQEISEEELRELETWLEESPANKSHLFELKNISDLSRNRSRIPHQGAEIEASWQRMQTRLDRKVSRSIPFISCLKYAAIIVVAMSIGWGIGTDRDHSALLAPATHTTAFNEVRVEKGGRANTLILSDGSKVILNAATVLKYPSSFDGDKRQVHLEGEAYFEVAENTDKPFIVKLNKQDITVLGTTFNIQAYGNEPFNVITLLSGSILLEGFNEFGESVGCTYLKPDQQAFSDNQTGKIEIRSVDSALSNAWINGEYKFKNESLSSIVKRLENYYNVRIHLDSPELEQIQYTGTFSLDQDILEVFRIIDYEKQFTFKRVKKDIFITSK